MCISMSRRHLIAISAAAVTTPHLSWAQNTDAIRSLHGALDIDSFKGKKGARLKASQQAVFSIGGDAFLTNSALEADVEIAEDGLVQKLTILSGEALAVLKPRISTDRFIVTKFNSLYSRHRLLCEYRHRRA